MSELRWTGRTVTLATILLAFCGCQAIRGAGSAPAGGAVRVMLVELGGAREGSGIGCGDRLLAVRVPVELEEDPLAAAIRALLDQGAELARVNGLYTALAASRLTLDTVEVRVGGEAVIHLSGVVRVGGACDVPRVVAQLERTAMQYPDIRSVRVLVDGVDLGELLSVK